MANLIPFKIGSEFVATCRMVFENERDHIPPGATLKIVDVDEHQGLHKVKTRISSFYRGHIECTNETFDLPAEQLDGWFRGEMIEYTNGG